jgi:hypothetical protein
MEGRRTKWYEERDPKRITSAVTFWGGELENMSRTLVELNFSSWSIMRLEAGFKDFIFKMLQGRLYLNQGLAHFANVIANCTFCGIICKRIMKNEGLDEEGQEWNNRLNGLRHESVQHIFWECEHVRTVIKGVGQRLARTNQGSFKKKEFFGGLEDINTQNMQITILIAHFVKYYIYLSRCKNKLPTVPQCMYEIEGLISILAKGDVWQKQVEDIPELVSRMLG